ncbi:hypothetical protein CL653_00225 [bacterium]|nr:hypothetical protein [bacterium]|tara:strand:+ start:876 stop:1292 length:417 start_codon:yes stop_codon:yes gene_type:complete
MTAILAVTGAVSVNSDTAYGKIVDSDRGITSLSPASTEQVVRSYFEDLPVMVEIARCESTFRHTLNDGTILRGLVDNRDTGVMQINTHYHEATATSLGLDLEYLGDNLEYARYLYETQGTQPWSASRPCWGGGLAYGS